MNLNCQGISTAASKEQSLNEETIEDSRIRAVAMKTKTELLEFLDSLIEQGDKARELEKTNSIRFNRIMDSLLPRINTLTLIYGNILRVWPNLINPEQRYQIDSIYGSLLALREAVNSDLLVRIEDMVLAEAMNDLLAQAEYLADKNYILAAGILGRAVLEEHLRKGCNRKGCLPTGRPTINDLNKSLYTNKHLDKLVMKQVDALASIGNHCAHNDQPPLDSDRIMTFLRDIREFITRHPFT